MVYSISSATLLGVEAKFVQVEIDLLNRLPAISIVGLPDNSVKESADRVRSALQHIGFSIPRKRIVINLAPADIKKKGTFFDLPIAIAIFLSTLETENNKAQKSLFVGELSLNGSLRPIKGALSFALLSKELGFEYLVLPKENAWEASLIPHLKICGFHSLKEVLDWLSNQQAIPTIETIKVKSPHSKIDMKDVRGQQLAKRALEIAAAGGHNILMMGSPGCGKTMLAQRLPTILPKLRSTESIEITQIYSVFGDMNVGLKQERPFRSPHHSISLSAMVGTAKLLPGEASLAHNGVLFLDEIAEFRRDVLEALRTPLQDKKIMLHRASGIISFPASFSLVAAANPCPCGWFHHPTQICRCRPTDIERYQNRLSGPLIDRIDLLIQLQPLSASILLQAPKGESSETIRERIEKARTIQDKRYQNCSFSCNSQLPANQILAFLSLTKKTKTWLSTHLEHKDISSRSVSSILKISRTIADIEDSNAVEIEHIIEAFHYKQTISSIYQ